MVEASSPVGLEGAARATPTEFRHVIAVAIGGAVGASGRWVIGELLDGADDVETATRFPWATLVVNVVGCLLIAVAACRMNRGGVGWSFWVTGGLGGFTTMSAVAVELNGAADAGRSGLVVVSLLATLLGSALAFGVGDRLARRREAPQREGPEHAGPEHCRPEAEA